MKTNYLTQAALIAAVYAVLTMPFAAISTGAVQVRISEVLTILPYFTPAAIPGLAIGCLISNIFISQFGMIDIVFGTMATLIAAMISYKLPKKLVPIPPILVNAVIVGLLINYGTFNRITWDFALWGTMLSVGIGQAIACYGLGYPLLLLIDKNKGMKAFFENREKSI